MEKKKLLNWCFLPFLFVIISNLMIGYCFIIMKYDIIYYIMRVYNLFWVLTNILNRNVTKIRCVFKFYSDWETGMLNNEKIILMTKLALYEQGKGKKSIPVGKYYKSDYVGMHLLSSFVYINVAYIIIFAIWVVQNSESLLKKLTTGKIFGIVFYVVAIYVAVVILYLIASYIYFAYKYKKIRRSLKGYHSNLRQLQKIQDIEIEKMLSDTENNIQLENEM